MNTPEQAAADAKAKAANKLQDDAIVGTLGIIASASAYLPKPIGTIASAVIYAGIGLFKTVEAIDAKEIADNIYFDQLKSNIEEIAVQKDALQNASRRPKVPLDLYSGPPMYWVVDSDPIADEDKHYRIPGGNVDWPATQEVGGRTVLFGSLPAQTTDLDVDYVYAAIPPKRNSTPSICVFFWAVPIFFARLSENLGELIFGKAYNPLAKCKFDNSKTNKEYLALYIKNIITQGRLDSAGNWFGKIGTIIPPLASEDNEYSGRYYGRMSWVHNLAMNNIIDSDGTRMAKTGLTKEDTIIKDNPKNLYQLDRSLNSLYASPRWTAINGVPVAQQSGYIFDLRDLLSKYWISDPVFDKLRSDLSANLRAKLPIDEENLYYVTTIEDIDETKYFPYSTIWGSSTYEPSSSYTYYGVRPLLDQYITKGLGIDRFGLSVYGYMNAISDAGGFYRKDRIGLKYEVSKSGYNITYGPVSEGYSKSIMHGVFALAPYSLYTYGHSVNGKANVYIGNLPSTSSYIFMDFDPTIISNRIIPTPGLWDGTKGDQSKYNWLNRLAIMPGYSKEFKAVGFQAILDSKNYNNFTYASSKTPAVDATSEFSSRYYTFTGKLVLKSNINPNKLPVNNSNLPLGKKWSELTPFIYEIIRTRPHTPGQQSVLLQKEYWTDVDWAVALAEQDKTLYDTGIRFEVCSPARVPNTPFMLGIFRIKREQISGSGTGKTATSAYYRTNLAENKPIVEIYGDNYPTPSPFYCGRRADARSQPIWKKLRTATNTINKVPQQSGDVDTGWEDCHEWSWPYQTGTLDKIGLVSSNLYRDYGEGIGRAGLSPSCIATGPTLWGDLGLFSKVYNKWTSEYNKDPTDKLAFAQALGVTFWTTIVEMQVGAYSRYVSRSNTMGTTLAESVQSKFGQFADNNTARTLFLNDIKASNTQPTVWDEKTQSYVSMTADQAADLCMSVVNAWFNGTFPRPTNKLTSSLSSGVWSIDMLRDVSTAHIMLKNWAIDLGKPDNQKIGAKFPSEWYSINFFGLNKSQQSAIDAFNESQNSKLAQTNPLAKLNAIINSEHAKSTAELAADGTIVKKSKVPVVIAASILSLLSAALAVAVIRKHKHNQSLTP